MNWNLSVGCSCPKTTETSVITSNLSKKLTATDRGHGEDFLLVGPQKGKGKGGNRCARQYRIQVSEYQVVQDTR